MSEFLAYGYLQSHACFDTFKLSFYIHLYDFEVIRQHLDLVWIKFLYVDTWSHLAYVTFQGQVKPMCHHVKNMQIFKKSAKS